MSALVLLVPIGPVTTSRVRVALLSTAIISHPSTAVALASLLE